MSLSDQTENKSTAGAPSGNPAPGETITMDASVWKTTAGLRRIIYALPSLVAFIDKAETLRFRNRNFEDWLQKPLSRL